jgi:uncharacterized protein YndB with AHSA1/START domain
MEGTPCIGPLATVWLRVMDAVERQVTLPVDLEEAWSLLTRPDDLTGWLGAEVELDPTPGHAGRVVDHDGTVRHLVVDDVQIGHRLSWRWSPEDEPSRLTRVEICLVRAAEGTTVRVVESALPGASVAQASTGEAWSHRLLHLEALLLVAAAVRG